MAHRSLKSVVLSGLQPFRGGKRKGVQPIAKGFTGHEQTDASGMIYMQARFYLPMYGRFASPDPGSDQHFEDTQSWNIYSYVQNNPVMHFDPDGMKLVLSGNAVAEFQKSMSYLSRSAEGRRVVSCLNKIRDSKTNHLNIVADARVAYAYSQGKDIQWNPVMGLALVDNPKDLTSLNGKVQSPALGLAHEVEHRMEKDKKGEDGVNRDPDPQYRNKEERRAVGKESTIATQLGEPTRDNSVGVDVRVKDSTSREAVDPHMKNRLEEEQQRRKK